MEFHWRHRGRQHAQPLDSKRRQFCMGDHRPCSSLHALRVPYVCAARSSISPQVDYPRRRDRVECRFWLNINAFAQRRPYRDGQQIQVCGRRCPKSRGRIHLHGKSRGCGWRRKASQDPAGRQQPLAVGHPHDGLAHMELVCPCHQPRQDGRDSQRHGEIRIDRRGIQHHCPRRRLGNAGKRQSKTHIRPHKVSRRH